MKTYFPLFSKFLLSIIFIVLLFGIVSIYIVRKTVYHSLDAEINKRGHFIANTLAEQALTAVLSNNIAGLNTLINNTMDIDTSIYYAFILNPNGKVLAHSFADAVPDELITANSIEEGALDNAMLIRPKMESNLLIKDFAQVIFSKNIGVVRVGLLENHIKSAVSGAVFLLSSMIVVFLIIGIIGALIFSYLIAKPIESLSQYSEIVDIENIPTSLEHIQEAKASAYFRFRKLMNTEDEIDILYEKFSLMLNRLFEKHNELSGIQLSMIQSEKMASIGTLSAGIAHEINNPIAGLKNCLRRMEEAPDNISQNIRYISLMSEALEKMQDVIQRLLDFSRKEKEDFRNIYMEDCINNALSLVLYKIEYLNINLRFGFPDNKKPILGNKNQIEQLVLNLVLNSIESIEEKKQNTKNDFQGEIMFSIQMQNDALIFKIIDNGLGIPDEHMTKLFDPFFSIKKIKQGTGLGLAVCHNIAGLHKAKIEASHNPTGGAIISIIFPVNEGGKTQAGKKIQNSK